MLKSLATCLLLLASTALPAIAQNAGTVRAKEAEIRATVPYVEMRREMPTLTLEQYNAAVRTLAKRELAVVSPWSTPPVRRAPSSSSATQLGSTTFYSTDTGVSGTANQIGGTTFYNFSDGVSGTSTRIGKTSFSHFNQGTETISGTSQRVGQVRFHNFSDGVSGTSTQIGGTTFHNFTDGTSCTTTTIGTTQFNNCH